MYYQQTVDTVLQYDVVQINFNEGIEMTVSFKAKVPAMPATPNEDDGDFLGNVQDIIAYGPCARPPSRPGHPPVSPQCG